MTTIPTPEEFMLLAGSEPDEDHDELTPMQHLADLERRVSALEAGTPDSVPRALIDDLTADYSGPVDRTAGPCPDCAEHQNATDNYREQLADLEAKHDVVLQLVEQVGGIVKKSTSKVSLEVKAAIDAWANPAPEGHVGKSERDAMLGAEADAGEGRGWWAHSTVPPQAPAHDADVEQWREYARSLGVLPDEPDAIDSMNRSQIRTMLGIEQPVGA